MFGFTRSPGSQGSNKNLVEGSSGYKNPFDSDSGSRDTSGCNYNPFDSDSESDTAMSDKQTTVTSSRRVFEAVVLPQDFGTPDRKISDSEVVDDVENRSVLGVEDQTVTGRRRVFEAVVLPQDFGTPDRKKSDAEVEDDVGNQSVLGFEEQAVHKAEETTSTVKKCLKIAEEIRGDAVRTLEMLHRQGQQITRTHHVAVDIDRDLSRGEKLLGSLGSIFSRTWKPNKGRDITGPLTMTDDNLGNSHHNKEQRENLGIVAIPKIRTASRTLPAEPTNAFQKVQLEKERQDDTLYDLSNILVDLKDMALEMGSEIDRQNKALDHFGGDVDELNFRVKGANQRTRQLLRK